MDTALKHIFDKGACLTSRQVKDYVKDTMTNDERHAVQVHLNSCMFCSDAMDGMQQHRHDGSVETMAALGMQFLNEGSGLSHPEAPVHATMPAHTAHPSAKRRAKPRSKPFRHTPVVALVLLLGLGYIWYREDKANGGSAHISTPGQSLTNTQTGALATVSEDKMLEQHMDEDVNAPGKDADVPAVQFASNEHPVTATAITKDNGLLAVSMTPVAIHNKTVSENAVIEKPHDEPVPVVDNKPKQEPQKTKLTVASAPVDKKTPLQEAPKTSAKKALATEAVQPDPPAEMDNMEAGDTYFDDQKYSAALYAYTKEMASPDTRTRQKATYMVARCYLNMGNKATAIRLLEQLAQESGPHKRAAKRLLRDLD